MADFLEIFETPNNNKPRPWFQERIREGFRYKDYLSWGDEFRSEIIDGMVYLMAGASIWHQNMIVELIHQLKLFFKDRTCTPFVAPVDVRLFPQDDLCDTTVVQPDILVVCDKTKIHPKYIRGVPDLIIEIMSNSSEGYDRITKKKLYERAGVREYWIVAENQIYRYHLQDGKYIESVYDYSAGFKLNPVIFPDCTLEF